MSNLDKSLVLAFIDYLNEQRASFTDSEKSESIEVAVQCLSDVYGINLSSSEDIKEYSIAPTKLADIMAVYLKKKSAAASPSVTETLSAEELKKKGNEELAKKNYQDAIDFYSRAISIEANAIFYSNRAAAYSYLGDDLKVIEDCQAAIKLDPTFVKAYTRLGLAEMNLGRYDDAVDTYQRALDIDPENEALAKSWELAMKKRDAPSSSPTSASTSSAGGFPSMPGGMDFSSILKNPEMMKMASELAKNGGLEELMKNPNIAQMAQSMFGGKPPGA